MSSFLIDSDIVIGVSRGQEAALALLLEVSDQEAASVPAVSAITVFEVLQGRRPTEDRQLDRFFRDSVRTLPITQDEAELGARLVREEKRRGRTLNMGDALIAATALLYQLVLVTGNGRHFAPLGVELYPTNAGPQGR